MLAFLRATLGEASMGDLYEPFTELVIDRPAPAVLRVTMSGPKHNALSPAAHAQLADVWKVIDRDPTTNVALLCGAGNSFSAGGSFELLQSQVDDYDRRAEAMREARDIVH